MAHYTGYERPREYNMAIPEYSTSHAQSPGSHSRSRSEKRSVSIVYVPHLAFLQIKEGINIIVLFLHEKKKHVVVTHLK